MKWSCSVVSDSLRPTPWTAACQAPLYMGFSWQQYWSGFHVLLQGIFPTQGSNPCVPHCRQMLLPSEPPGKSLKWRDFLKWRLKRKWSRSVASDSLWPHEHQAPPSMGFSRQEYWSGLPFPYLGNFSTQGSNPGLLHCRQTLYFLSSNNLVLSLKNFGNQKNHLG